MSTKCWQSARRKWAQQQQDDQVALHRHKQQLEVAYQQRVAEADQFVREAEQSLVQQRQQEQLALEKTLDMQRKEVALADVQQERMQVAVLKRDTEARSMEVEAKWSSAMSASNNGRDALARAERLMQEVARLRFWEMA